MTISSLNETIGKIRTYINKDQELGIFKIYGKNTNSESLEKVQDLYKLSVTVEMLK